MSLCEIFPICRQGPKSGPVPSVLARALQNAFRAPLPAHCRRQCGTGTSRANGTAADGAAAGTERAAFHDNKDAIDRAGVLYQNPPGGS
jgi:hypothetical protein